MNSFPASGIISNILFVGCLAITVFGALVAVISGRLIRGVSGLAICCSGLAGLFYFLHSPFLAMMEILIYIGAVCVTIVFAIMLAEPDEPEPREGATKGVMWGGLAGGAALAIFAGLSHLGTRSTWPNPVQIEDGFSVTRIGLSLLTTYSMAFELISLALLVAILGALAIARLGRSKQE